MWTNRQIAMQDAILDSQEAAALAGIKAWEAERFGLPDAEKWKREAARQRKKNAKARERYKRSLRSS